MNKLIRAGLLAILCMWMCMNPASVLASGDVTLNPIPDTGPGQTVIVNGTASFSRVGIQVNRPNGTMLDLDTTQADGDHYSYSFTLPADTPEGIYTVFAGRGATVVTTTFAVSAAAVVNPTGVSITGEGGSHTIEHHAGTLQLTALVLPAGAPQAVIWSVSDPDLAEIDGDGLLLAKRNGVVTVTAASAVNPGIAGMLQVTISGQRMPFAIEHTSLSREPGILAEAVVVPAEAGGQAAVLFQLLDGDGNVLQVAVAQRYISGPTAFAARFPGFQGNSYRVAVKVWETFDSTSGLDGVSLADPVLLD